MSKIELKEYTAYHNMKARCYNSENPHYINYGGRGIKVCKRWLESFDNFLEDMGERPEGMSLERIDNNKGYSKNNCKWADRTTQNLNRREQPSKLIKAFGVTKSINQWSKDNNVKRLTIYQRLHRGWSNERAVSE